MDVGSSFSIYGNLFGWYVNNQMVYFVIATGFWLIPYFFIFYSAVWGSRASGERFDAVAILVKLEFQIYISIFVILLFLNPSVSVSNLNFNYTNNGTVEDGSGGSKGYSQLAGIAPDSVKVPPVWYGVIVFTHSFSGVFKSLLPSSGEARKLMHQMQQIKVKDPVVQKAYNQFKENCLVPAQLNLAYTMKEENSGSGLHQAIKTAREANDASYPDGSESYRVSGFFPGSDLFKTYFYSDNFCPVGDNSGLCIPRGSGASLAPHKAGKSDCKAWWDDTMRERLRDELDKDSGMSSGFWDNDSNLSAALTNLSRKQFNDGAGKGINDKKGNIFQKGAELFGAAATNVGSFFGEFTNSILRFALPLLQGIISMFIIMVLPILILFGCYSLDKMASIVITFFGLLMLPAIWHVIGWVDNVLLVSLWPKEDFIDDFVNFFSISRAAFNFIILSSYIIFTYLWIGLVQSIGGGLSHALSSSMGGASQGAGASAQKGVNMGVNKAPAVGKAALEKYVGAVKDK